LAFPFSGTAVTFTLYSPSEIFRTSFFPARGVTLM
jgi:hypothetical protein